jgi:hypothetical protein
MVPAANKRRRLTDVRRTVFLSDADTDVQWAVWMPP